MPEENCAKLTRFILLGFTDHPAVEIPLFGLFLLIYTTLVENICLIVLIQLIACLHIPMYYFLSNLSFLDLSCSSAICSSPKMLVNLLAQWKTIYLIGCATQRFFAAFADAECLIGAMAYDHVAICHPLLYITAMSHRICTSSSGGLTLLVQSFTLLFCGSNMISHFFCDAPPLLELSCSKTHINKVLLFSLCGFIQTSTFLTIKAFYTCTSHLMLVGLFYVSLFTYLQPSSSYSLGTDKVISVFYTVMFPMLNLRIYSLRNKEVKDALRRTVERKVFSQRFS
ncbi:LOW QUALITY PROTEIN: olfactory receptor 5AS1-like [Rhynochetos jubatus]